MGPLNHQKIDKIRAWTSQSPSLCPPMSQDRPRIVPGLSQGPPGRQSRGTKHACQTTPIGTKNYKNSVKIQAWTSKRPLLCSPMSQNRSRVPQDAKVKLPIMQNEMCAYQECQGPLATMPKICNPKAMSNGRGPAAEAVAHKVV